MHLMCTPHDYLTTATQLVVSFQLKETIHATDKHTHMPSLNNVTVLTVKIKRMAKPRKSADE